uniref:TPX2 domain-containing protein n=1 Tax=Caenorhabditis tropicalis TaxID=1561998 RepID=A0A1I7UHP2_9PELO
MASSAGRDKIRSRGQRVFAFGSSTPRDLSHMNKVPPKLRSYDAKSVEKPVDTPSLHDYIVKARSLSREGGDSRNQFVFGSSTPRTLAHLDKIPHKQRVYDAKIPKKSATHGDFKAAPIRFNAPPAPITKPVKKEENRHVITSKDDDIASEPDIVQDREEFMNEMKKHKQELEKKKSLGQSGRYLYYKGTLRKEHSDSKNPMEVQPPNAAETHQEHVKFAHAPEISGNAQKAVRIHSETQEEPAVAVKNLSANKMNDQIEVSQLMNEITPESVPAIESTDNQKNVNVVGDLLAKVQKVAEESVDKTEIIVDDVAKTIKNGENEISKKTNETLKDIKTTVDSTKKDIENNIAEKVDDITKSLEDSAKSLEDSKSKIGKSIENTTSEIKSKLGNVTEKRKNLYPIS